MANYKCPSCGGNTKKFGKTAAGSQRWRCKSCGATFTHAIDSSAKQLASFLSWLFSRKRQSDMPGGGRTFRRKCARFWDYWPRPAPTGEVCRVIFVDGIYVTRNVVVLIARSEYFVLGWYLARSENANAWAALMAPIPTPEVVVTDGGSGFEKARRAVWPDARVQRCTFHVWMNIKNYTTLKPKLPAGAQLLQLGRDLLIIRSADEAALWLARYSSWCSSWKSFLAEKTRTEDGRLIDTHERLVKAQNMLNVLIRKGTLFTYVDPELTDRLGELPSKNNMIEGGVNAQLRTMLRDHRGLSTTRRVKAIFWWCLMNTECPPSSAEILRTTKTDEEIDGLFQQASRKGVAASGGPEKAGAGVVWSEFHTSTPWQSNWD